MSGCVVGWEFGPQGCGGAILSAMPCALQPHVRLWQPPLGISGVSVLLGGHRTARDRHYHERVWLVCRRRIPASTAAFAGTLPECAAFAWPVEPHIMCTQGSTSSISIFLPCVKKWNLPPFRLPPGMPRFSSTHQAPPSSLHPHPQLPSRPLAALLTLPRTQLAPSLTRPSRVWRRRRALWAVPSTPPSRPRRA